MTRLILLGALAALVSGCAASAHGYLTADQCWEDRECRREWLAEERVERRKAWHSHNRREGMGKRKKLDTILAEQDFAHSDRADPGAAKLSKLGKVLGVRYIITGSITKFGGEDKAKGASIKGIHVGRGSAKQEVSVTARLVDTTTGEVVLAAKGEGTSKKGGGFSFGKSGLGSYGQESSDFKSSAIGEAQEAACKDLVAKIVAKKDRIED